MASVSDWFEVEELEATGEVELEASFTLGEAWRRGDEPPTLVGHVRVVGTGEIVTEVAISGALSLMAEELEGRPETPRGRPEWVRAFLA